MSADARIPSLPYLRAWSMAVVLAAAMIGLSEARWRAQGIRPDVADTKELWCTYRSGVYSENGRKKMVIVGASRAQLGIEPVALSESFPEFDVVHLAIRGFPVLAFLEDLADDPEFDGVVLASVTADGLVPPRTTKGRRDDEYVEFYHREFLENGFLVNRAESRLKAFLQSKLVLLSVDLSSPQIFFQRTEPQYQSMRYDRYRPAHYERLTSGQLEAARRARVQVVSSLGPWSVTESEFRLRVGRHLKPHYERLRARGGDMVLVRMPTTGDHWAATEARTPKAKYWDAIEGITGVPTIHFNDHEDLAGFDCPDSSHLDSSDAPEFTRRLARHVRARLVADGTLD